MSGPDYTDAEGVRFWSYVAIGKADECWPWQRSRDRAGYGVFSAQGSRWKAHRVALVLSGRTIDAGLVVDHVCRSRSCVNPAHLRVVTPRINTIENSVSRPAVNAAKTHCKNGHPLSGDNLRMYGNSRICVTCFNKPHRASKGSVFVPRRISPTCRKGHLKTGDNLRIDWDGYPRCRICERERERNREATRAPRDYRKERAARAARHSSLPEASEAAL